MPSRGRLRSGRQPLRRRASARERDSPQGLLPCITRKYGERRDANSFQMPIQYRSIIHRWYRTAQAADIVNLPHAAHNHPIGWCTRNRNTFNALDVKDLSLLHSNDTQSLQRHRFVSPVRKLPPVFDKSTVRSVTFVAIVLVVAHLALLVDVK